MAARIWADRSAAASRRRRGVVRPSSTAWRIPSSICSGCAPSSSASTSVRSSVVASIPSTSRISDEVSGRSNVCTRTPTRGRSPRLALDTDRCSLVARPDVLADPLLAKLSGCGVDCATGCSDIADAVNTLFENLLNIGNGRRRRRRRVLRDVGRVPLDVRRRQPPTDGRRKTAIVNALVGFSIVLLARVVAGVIQDSIGA